MDRTVEPHWGLILFSNWLVHFSQSFWPTSSVVTLAQTLKWYCHNGTSAHQHTPWLIASPCFPFADMTVIKFGQHFNRPTWAATRAQSRWRRTTLSSLWRTLTLCATRWNWLSLTNSCGNELRSHDHSMSLILFLGLRVDDVLEQNKRHCARLHKEEQGLFCHSGRHSAGVGGERLDLVWKRGQWWWEDLWPIRCT